MKRIFASGATVMFAAAVITMIGIAPCHCPAGEKGRVFLWSVTGVKGTVYLLGSVHVLREDAYPLDKRIEQAYAKSGRIVFEADQEEISGPELQKELIEHGTYAGDDVLSGHIPKGTYELLEKKAREAGLDVSQLQKLKPWLCAVTLSGAELSRMGFSPENGLDAHYAARAGNDGKERVYLETARFQVELLSRMPEDRQEELLRQAVEELDVIREKSAALAGAWKTGDAVALEAIVSISLSGHPQIRKDLFTDRNERWVPRLEELLQGEGDTLVIVGAGHLVGDDGILNLLRRKGYSPVQQ